MKYNIPKTLALIILSLAVAGGLLAAPPTAEEVGDIGSFGHKDDDSNGRDRQCQVSHRRHCYLQYAIVW